jgi:molybdopterin/thiamine biosynthesis adenylyltransferase
MPSPWWKRLPGRLRRELKDLRLAGIRYTTDKEAFRNGTLRLTVWVTHNAIEHRLIANYPDTFPFFRVVVYAPELSLARHQNPFSKSLCLIGRRTEKWQPSDTLAWLIREQFPKVLAAASAVDRSTTADIEENQGEPIITFYSYLPRSVVLVDSSWAVPESCPNGWLHLGVGSFRPQLVRAAVLKVCDADRRVIASAEPSIAELYGQKNIWVRWTRHSDFIAVDQPSEFLERLVKHDQFVAPFSWHRSKGVALDLTGVLMSQEVERGREQDSWLFVLRASRGRGLPRPDPGRTKLVQSQGAGKKDLAARSPETAFLARKSALVVGLGCIGASVALELSKAGCGNLVLADSDIVEPGQTIRWPVGLEYVGENKAHGLSSFISKNWPYTKVVPINTPAGAETPLDQELIDQADLVLDCSAEVGVQRYLATLCREHAKTLVIASTTPGARGGIVARFPADRAQYCFECWELHQSDGAVPNPPEDATGFVQPAGCADPTFTGTGFDAMEISLMAARTAVGELGRGETGAYPAFQWNAAVLSLRRGSSHIIPPLWETRDLPPHPRCKERHS